jgi:heme exporter protein CcmD
MNGYGFYIWLSFGLTILACAALYYRTYKTLKKYEKEFALEIRELSNIERKKILKESKIANQVLASYSQSI